MKVNIEDLNLNQSNKSITRAMNRVQNSLNKLHSAINNKTNIGKRNKNKIKDLNLRKRILSTKNNVELKKNDIFLTEDNTEQTNPIGYSMFNNNSIIRTDKRSSKKKLSQDDNLYNDFEYFNNSTENIPKPFNSKNYNKRQLSKNFNQNMKWKCATCGNINLLYNNFCINCGNSKRSKIKNSLSYNNNNNNNNINNINDIIIYKNSSYDKIDNDLNINNSNMVNSYTSNSLIESTKPNKQFNMKYSFGKNSNYNNIKSSYISTYYNKDSKIGNFKSWIGTEKNLNEKYRNINTGSYLDDLNNDIIDYNINYKKLNDLYLYGDYLESELKQSNDENIKLLERFKDVKNDVYLLNQKNKKLKLNIEELQKKENQLNLLNTQLKNGFSLVKSKFGNENELDFSKNENIENITKLKDFELKNKICIENQKKYDEKIENLKQRIESLVGEGEDDIGKEEKSIKDLENQIEKEKKILDENNAKYILLLKNNDELNNKIKDLENKLDINNLNDDDIDNNENNENIVEDPIKKIELLKKNISLYDKEINENKIITNNLIKEYKDITNLSEIKSNNINKENNNDNNDDDEESKNEYLLLKEKNNKLYMELSKLKDISKKLIDSKDQIIDIYENEINKLKNFYLKAKEKTSINKNINKEEDQEKNKEKIMKIKIENEEIKKENFELIKDLDQLSELQQIYQGLIDENKKFKLILNKSELDEGDQIQLNDIINEENFIQEDINNDDDNNN